MENKSSNGWKFFALLFGGLLAALVGLYIYKQQNPDYDPWEEHAAPVFPALQRLLHPFQTSHLHRSAQQRERIWMCSR